MKETREVAAGRPRMQGCRYVLPQAFCARHRPSHRAERAPLLSLSCVGLRDPRVHVEYLRTHPASPGGRLPRPLYSALGTRGQTSWSRQGTGTIRIQCLWLASCARRRATKKYRMGRAHSSRPRGHPQLRRASLRAECGRGSPMSTMVRAGGEIASTFASDICAASSTNRTSRVVHKGLLMESSPFPEHVKKRIPGLWLGQRTFGDRPIEIGQVAAIDVSDEVGGGEVERCACAFHEKRV